MIGLLQFFVTKSWVTMLLLGEVAGLVYVTVRGSIFRDRFSNVPGTIKKTEM